jgi:hypothetical protein
MKPTVEYMSISAASCPDVKIEDFHPEISDNFWCCLYLGIGPDNADGHHDYWFQIGTPRAFDHKIQNEGPMWGRHYMIVNYFNASEIRSVIEKKVAECARPTFEETALVLSRFFHWEFEDYQE